MVRRPAPRGPSGDPTRPGGEAPILMQRHLFPGRGPLTVRARMVSQGRLGAPRISNQPANRVQLTMPEAATECGVLARIRTPLVSTEESSHKIIP